MAIQAKVVKGGMSMSKAYLMISAVRMEKYLDPDTKEDRLIYTAKVDIYGAEKDRKGNSGQADFNHSFKFEHLKGGDLIDEAYKHIKTFGLPGWTLAGQVDV